MTNYKQTIGIIGAGYVGLATGLGFQKMGNPTTFYDINFIRRQQLQQEKYKVTEYLEDALNNQIVFICVQTPSKEDGTANTTFVEKAFDQIKKTLPYTKQKPILVLRSTVPPGTTRQLAKQTNLPTYHNPEFLQQATAQEDFLHPDRIVIGSKNKETDERLIELYKTFHAPIFQVTYEESELIKYTSNALYSVNISFWNEINQIADATNASRDKVREAVQAGKHFGKHPWHTGTPYGGACLPKDIKALIQIYKKHHIQPTQLQATEKVNQTLEQKIK